MKNILNLKGVKTLTKKEQGNLFGARLFSSCQQKGRLCCQDGVCELGSCERVGGSSFCIWY